MKKWNQDESDNDRDEDEMSEDEIGDGEKGKYRIDIMRTKFKKRCRGDSRFLNDHGGAAIKDDD